MLKRIAAFYARYIEPVVAGLVHFAPWLPAAVVGIITGWAARMTAWMNEAAPFSWVAAGLLAAALWTAINAVWLWSRTVAATLRFNQRLEEAGELINPLDTAFHRKRIKLENLISPVNRRIEDKQFHDCELIGPINLAIMPDTHILGVSFADCDVVFVDKDAQMTTVVGIHRCKVMGGVISRATLFVPEAWGDLFSGGNVITVKPGKADREAAA